jgi:hypothetical protein
MGFGFKGRALPNLKRIILEASNRNVIMFAPPGNHGANDTALYPASDPKVICIYSTDAYGNRSAFNPPPLLYSESFSTLGEEVESLWPSDSGILFQRKSGTTISATIAAAIAALILHFIRNYEVLSPQEDLVLFPKENVHDLERIGPTEMRKIFDLMAVERDGYKYLVPWRLLDWSDFESNDHIMRAILQAIRRM